MGYYDLIENRIFNIQTGDGQLYFPLWKGGTKETEFNTSMFDFINVTGTLVDRKKARSPFFNMVFYFQGENYLEEVSKFEISAADSRPWVVYHPIYGSISGQPLSLKRDDSNINIVEITVPFWESIEADYPFSNFNIKDNTREKHDDVYALSSISYITNIPIAPADIPKLKTSITDMSGAMKSMQNNTTYSEFQNQLNKGLKAIDNLLEDPLNAIQNIQAFLDLPITYSQVLEARMASYEAIYSRLESTVSSVADKKYFESISASLLASFCVVLVTPQEGDYVLVSDVFSASERLATIYSKYLAKLDEVKISVYDVNKSYNPDPSVQSELSSLVKYTISNLYKLSFEAKREKIIFVDKDTNPILLVHRYIGLDASDENLVDFIVRNDIKLKELFLIKKGRQVKFTI